MYHPVRTPTLGEEIAGVKDPVHNERYGLIWMCIKAA
jgi:hypothetical protein